MTTTTIPAKGKLTIDMPYFREIVVRDVFRSRITPDMSEDSMKQLNQEFKEACKQAEKEIEKEQAAVAACNLQTFLDNPTAVLQELEADAGRVFSVGEMLLGRGIATVKSVRFGKGVLVGKGTNYPYMSSCFKVTVKIGTHTETSECNSNNDKRSKKDMEAMFVHQLARKICVV